MAFVRAVSSGNWSNTAIWHTNALPQNGDTVYANGFTVTIDQDVLIGDTNNFNVNAGSFIAGCWYEVVSVGTTNFALIGGSNTVGSVFLATGVGTGSGVAKTIATLSNAANTPASAAGGGGFSISATNVNVSCDFRSSSSTTCLTVASSNVTTKGNIQAGTSHGAYGINCTGSTNLTHIGDCRVTGNADSPAINILGSGIINITGNLYGATSSVCVTVRSGASGTLNITGNLQNLDAIANNGHAVRLMSGSTTNLNVTGNVIGGNGGSSADGIRYESSGIVNIVGNVLSLGNGYGVNINTTAGNLTITGNIDATVATINPILFSPNFGTPVNHTGSTYDNASGTVAVQARRYRNATVPSQAVRRKAVNGSSTFVNFLTIDNPTFDHAAPINVRNGTVYAGGNLTGTCRIPSANNVAFNVPVDNTVGAAVLRPSDVWDHLRANINTEGSIGERLKQSVMVNDIGKLFVDTLT